MPNNNNCNREDNKGCLEAIFEIIVVSIVQLFSELFVGIIKIIFVSMIEVFSELAKKFLAYIFIICMIAFLIYLLVTFLINHV